MKGPFAVCINPSCDFALDYGEKIDWDSDPEIIAPCSLCGWEKTRRCLGCWQIIWPRSDGDDIRKCARCHSDVRKMRIRRRDREAYLREERIEAAVGALDEMIVLVMDRVAEKHNILPEELADACNRKCRGDGSDDSDEW